MEIEIILVLIFIFLVYFLPSFVGIGKRNSGAIFVLNLFLGCTFIGWVVALVWACCDDEPVRETQVPKETDQLKPDKYDEIEKLFDLKTKGIISEEEFAKQKQLILETAGQETKSEEGTAEKTREPEKTV